jgi:transposase
VKLRHVIHHRRHTLTCPGCRKATTALPVSAAASGFGPRVQATVAYLAGVSRLGKRAIRQLFADLCDLPLSLGMVSKLERHTAAALAPLHANTLAATQGHPANVDETG